MTNQLHLLDDIEHDWRIPEATREIGRRGLAEARAVLRSIPRRHDVDHHDDRGDHHDHHPAAA